MPAGKQAEHAAALLASLNGLIGMAFMAAGMPESAATLAANNDKFQSMAQQALSTDPKLCAKILSTGATGGKAGLVMAYVMLGVSVGPSMKAEYRQNHPKEVENYGD
jgi:tetrahydromethanopterin S-methyltransferase subunit F